MMEKPFGQCRKLFRCSIDMASTYNSNVRKGCGGFFANRAMPVKPFLQRQLHWDKSTYADTVYFACQTGKSYTGKSTYTLA